MGVRLGGEDIFAGKAKSFLREWGGEAYSNHFQDIGISVGAKLFKLKKKLPALMFDLFTNRINIFK